MELEPGDDTQQHLGAAHRTAEPGQAGSLSPPLWLLLYWSPELLPGTPTSLPRASLLLDSWTTTLKLQTFPPILTCWVHPGLETFAQPAGRTPVPSRPVYQAEVTSCWI